MSTLYSFCYTFTGLAIGSASLFLYPSPPWCRGASLNLLARILETVFKRRKKRVDSINLVRRRNFNNITRPTVANGRNPFYTSEAKKANLIKAWWWRGASEWRKALAICIRSFTFTNTFNMRLYAWVSRHEDQNRQTHALCKKKRKKKILQVEKFTPKGSDTKKLTKPPFRLYDLEP
jgi:hypothetical protein